MHLNDRQKLVLLGVLEDQRRLAALPCGMGLGRSRSEIGHRRILVRNAQQGLVPMNLADWIGHIPTNSDCVLFHREYLRLENMGLIERHNFHGGQRTSHLRLTPAGRRVAEELMAQEYGQDSVEFDKTIDWSGLEHLFIEALPETNEAKRKGE